MTVLVVEDNDIKFRLIEEVLYSSGRTMALKRAESYQSGIVMLIAEEFDFVILDMTLPVYDHVHSVVGAEELTFGGELILRESRRRMICAQFIVISQYDSFMRGGVDVTFDQLRLELMSKYAPAVIGCVRLDNSSVEWRNQVQAFIEKL